MLHIKNNVINISKRLIAVHLAVLLIFPIIIIFSSCNFCPNNPSDGSSSGNELYFSLAPINSNLPIIIQIDVNSFYYNQLADNGYLYSAPSQNGNFAFIRINTTDNKKILMLGNVFSKSIQQLQQEAKNISIYYPILSPKGDKIVFQGGSNQLFLWVNDIANQSSFIDKISSAVVENSIPCFSGDGSKLAFFEISSDSNLVLKIIDSDKPDNIINSFTFQNEKLLPNIENYITLATKNQNLFFVTQNDSSYFFRTININSSIIHNSIINKNNFEVKIAKISPNGDYVIFSTSNGNLWSINLTTSEPLYNKLTNVNACEKYIYFNWNKEGTKIVAQKIKCNSPSNVYSDAVVFELSSQNNILSVNNSYMVSNNVITAFWGN
ncbi:MAG: hypothetical protein ACPL1A_09025 [Candidatus Kapaibacteriota bacterium]